MSSNFFSYVFNYRDRDGIGVDPRTGQFNVNIPLETLIGNNLLGPEFPLTLSYNPLDSRNQGFGDGFSLSGLSQFDKTTNRLELSNGETYMVEPGTVKIRHYPGKEFKFVYINGRDDTDDYHILWKDGKIEKLEKIAGNDLVFFTTVITSPLGYPLRFRREWNAGYAQITSIEDKLHILCQIAYQSDYSEMTVWPGTDEEYKIKFELADRRRLEDIIFLTVGQPQWSFLYGYIDDNWGLRLSRIIHPNGMIERVEYSGEKGLSFPEGSGMAKLPVVTSYTRIPGGGEPNTTITYEYTSANFLGGPGGDFGAWSANEDYIYKIYSPIRIYGSMAIFTKDSISFIATRLYDNYHLLKEEIVRKMNEDLYEQRYIYYAQPSTNIDDQVAQFRLPRSLEESWYHQSTLLHSQTTKTEYDEYGNLTREETSVNGSGKKGTITEISWYKAEGEEGCPAEGNGFVRFMKEQTITPMETKFSDAPIIKTRYIYENIGTTLYIVPKSSSVYSDNVLLGEQVFTYYYGLDHLSFGRLRSIYDTKYENGLGSQSFTSTMNMSILIHEGTLYPVIATTGLNGLSWSTAYAQSVWSSRVLERRDEQGVFTEYGYDRLGRITKRIDAKGTEYENQLTWSYMFNPPGFMAIAAGGAIAVKTDMLNNKIRSRFDGNGEMILQERADANAPDRWYTVFQKPDPASAAADLTNILSPEADEETGPRIEVISDKRIGKPTKLSRIDSKGTEQAKCLYEWDGFKRLRRETDELGRITSYWYDAYNRLVTKRLPDGTEIKWSYAPHLSGDQTASVHVTGYDGNGQKKTWEVGRQEFDSLGRVKERTSFGRSIYYNYQKTSPIPISIDLPSGKKIKYTAISQLNNTINRIEVDSITQSFTYDRLTGYPKNIEEGVMKLSEERDSRGRLITENFSYENVDKKAEYTWMNNGDLSTYKDVTGIGSGEYAANYNDAGQLSQIDHSDLTADLSYDDRGRLKKQKVQAKSGTLSLTTELTYDDFDREIKRLVEDSLGKAIEIEQTWTKNDRLASRKTLFKNDFTREESYIYDGQDRLRIYTVTGDGYYTKDAYGIAITRQHYYYDALNNIIQVETNLADGSNDIAAFSYENEKDPTQLTTITHTNIKYPGVIDLFYDVEGRLLRDTRDSFLFREFNYDELGRLNSVSNKGADSRSTYQYDGLNRLVRQKVYWKKEGVERETVHEFYYCDDRLVNEVIKEQGSAVRQKSFIKLDNSCLAVNDNGGLILTGCYQNGSLIWATDNYSNILEYWPPYGHKENSGLLGFNGERLDPISGCYPLGNGYRFYDPVLMRFTSPDDFSPFGEGGINPYAYCDNDPINYIDPSGHLSWMAITGITLGVIGLALTAGMAGAAIIAAGGVMAALSSASATALIIGGIGVAADVAAIASGVLEANNPQTSSVLGWVSLGLGVTGMATGMGKTISAFIKARAVNRAPPTLSAIIEELELVDLPARNGMRNIDIIEDGIYTFTDTYKGANRLNIDVHGKLFGRSSRILVGEKGTRRRRYLDAEQLGMWLRQNYDLRAYDNIRTISCHSGNGGTASFAARLSRATGKPVKGYIGTISALPTLESVIGLFKQAGTREVYEAYHNYFASKRAFRIFKYNPFRYDDARYYTWSYNPVKFYPS